MDILSLIGVLLGFAALIGGNFLEGGHLSTLINGPAALIVIGGTIGAAALQTPRDIFVRAMRRSVWVFSPPNFDIDFEIKRIYAWALLVRKEGVLGLEKQAALVNDPFRKKALQMLIDGFEPFQIRSTLELELVARDKSNREAAHVFDAMGGYAPTIGIIGAVLGLIHVMGNLSDPAELGSGIAVAFVATIYGVGIANLLLLPVANKIRAYAEREAQLREMFIEGVLSICDGDNPNVIQEKLRGFVHV